MQLQLLHPTPPAQLPTSSPRPRRIKGSMVFLVLKEGRCKSCKQRTRKSVVSTVSRGKDVCGVSGKLKEGRKGLVILPSSPTHRHSRRRETTMTNKEQEKRERQSKTQGKQRHNAHLNKQKQYLGIVEAMERSGMWLVMGYVGF